MNNHINKNRASKMIKAWLDQKPELLLTELRRMAERYETSEDVLADFLVNGNVPRWTWESDEYGSGHECTAEQWSEYMKLCHSMTQCCQITGKEDLEKLARYAAVGGWPTRLPEISRDTQEDWVNAFLEMNYTMAWVWTWIKSPGVVERFINGCQPSWVPAYHSSGWIIAEAFCDAVKLGFIQIPEEKKIEFAITYANWYANVHVANAHVAHLCFGGYGWNWETLAQLPVDDLQNLATVWGHAAYVLGKRRIPLLLPKVQNQNDWLNGFEHTIFVKEITFQEAAEAYLQTTNVFERWVIWKKFSQITAINPEDLFGSELQIFPKLVGEENLPSSKPTYEEALKLIAVKRRGRKAKTE